MKSISKKQAWYAISCVAFIIAILFSSIWWGYWWGYWDEETHTPTPTNNSMTPSELQDSQNMVLNSECSAAIMEREIIEEEEWEIYNRQYPNETSRDQDLENLKEKFIITDEKIRSICPESYLAEE